MHSQVVSRRGRGASILASVSGRQEGLDLFKRGQAEIIAGPLAGTAIERRKSAAAKGSPTHHASPFDMTRVLAPPVKALGRRGTPRHVAKLSATRSELGSSISDFVPKNTRVSRDMLEDGPAGLDGA